LARFADDGVLTMHLAGKRLSREIGIRDAAVRTNFYRRTRPDGTRIDDIEWSLSKLEQAAVPVLRQVTTLWPLGNENKAALAALFAYQTIRGPRWMEWHNDETRAFFEEARDTTETEEHAALDQTERHLLTDTARLIRMLALGPKVTNVLGSMHWSLVAFPSPWLATSDHPVVLWPIDQASRAPSPTPLNVGFLRTLEVTVPVSPNHAILMTWRDERDAASPLLGAKHHAANLNAFTVANAERQWFHRPGKVPPRSSGMLRPVSAELLRPYNSQEAWGSMRRAEIDRRTQAKLGVDDLQADYEIVTIDEIRRGS